MDCIVFRPEEKISVFAWWTIFCLVSSPCTSNMTWRAPPIRDELPLRRGKRLSPLTKTWTLSRTCLTDCCWKQITIMPCARPYRGTAWWVTDTCLSSYDWFYHVSIQASQPTWSYRRHSYEVLQYARLLIFTSSDTVVHQQNVIIIVPSLDFKAYKTTVLKYESHFRLKFHFWIRFLRST